MFHKGTLDEFNAWHDAAKIAEGIPVEGKVGFNGGSLAPNNQRTYSVSSSLKHPTNNDYIWVYANHKNNAMISYTLDEVQTLGWYLEE